ncbi:MAG: type II secretion system protein [Bdellovibrionota bacterium]
MKKNKFFRHVRNESGMTLLEVGVAAIISVIVVTVGISLANSWQKQGVQMGSQSWLAQARTDINISLQDEQTFDATIHRAENAASFACLLSKGDCRGAGGPLVIQAKAGLKGLTTLKPLVKQVFNPFDAGHPNAGLSPKGEPCNEYSPAGNDKCPFRFTANWQALCPGAGKCFDPGIEVDVVLSYNPTAGAKNRLTLNTSSYSVSFRKGQAVTDISALCNSINGYIDGSGHCVTTLAVGCPPGQFILGFTASSAPYCGYTFGGLNPAAPPTMCPLGEVLLGLDSTGVAHCGPGCASTSSSDLGNIFPNSSL